jgi:hypothetical protein
MIPGSTSQSVHVFIQDSTSTTGAGLTGLAYNTGSLTAYYSRTRGAATSITLATLAAANSAYSSGGFKEIETSNMPGLYRFDIPDACLASGVRAVTIMLKGAANMAPVTLEIDLGLVGNIWDEVLTAPTHNIANSAGRLLRLIVPTSDTIRSGTAQAGAASTITLDSGASAVNSVYNGTVISLDGGTGSGQSRIITGYVGATKVATVDSAWTVTPDNTSTFDITATANAKVTSYLTGQDPFTLVHIGDWTTLSGEAARSTLNALRFLRNKWSLSGATLTVCEEDDSTQAWTSTVTTNAGADPITASDPS